MNVLFLIFFLDTHLMGAPSDFEAIFGRIKIKFPSLSLSDHIICGQAPFKAHILLKRHL